MRHETARRRQGRKIAAQRVGGRFDDGAAILADQENHEILFMMAVATGKEGVARGEPVDQPVFKQEIERPVDRDGSGALAGRLGDLFDHVIGAERAAFAGEDFEDQAAGRRQPHAMRVADLFGRLQRMLGRARVLDLPVLVRFRLNRRRHSCNIVCPGLIGEAGTSQGLEERTWPMPFC